ncbi:MAG: hypothetical protein AB7R77_27875 [Ilumatobacteraceae bacterium]
MIEWLGKPWTAWQRETDSLEYSKVQSHFLERGIYQSGQAEQALRRETSRQRRRRAHIRLASAAVVVGVVFAGLSAFTDNRVVDAVGRMLGALLGGLALLVFAGRRSE